MTPIRTGELFLAKTLPTLLLGLLSIFPSLLIVRGLDVPIRGQSAPVHGLECAVSHQRHWPRHPLRRRLPTLQQAWLLSFFGLVPLMFLSRDAGTGGEHAGALAGAVSGQPLAALNMNIILGIFPKGAGMSVLWPETLALAVIGAFLFGAAAIIFRAQSGFRPR